MKRVSRWVFFLILTVASLSAGAQPATRLDDPFLDQLVGQWDLSRRIRGTIVANTLTTEWVLQHRFVQLHMKDAADPPKYEALVLIGYDAEARRYVAHWCDTFGAQYSAMGYGKRAGNAIHFVFTYPDGPFHNTFTWNPEAGTWTMLLENEGKDGKRSFFAEDSLKRK